MSQRLCFPVNHVTPTIAQRREFYSEEFDVAIVKRWFAGLPELLRNPIFAVDVGTETGLARRKHKASVGKLVLFSLAKLTDLKKRLTDYSPEDVYYDRNLYEDKERCIGCKKRGEKDCYKCTNITGQHVMFDVDPENINCPNCGTLEERIKRKSMYQFCYICFRKAAMFTQRLHDILARKGYEKLEIIYSGRGFHLYIEDPESYGFGFDKRETLAKWIGEQERIPIDPWVTRGGTRFARLPYSLHGLVGKIVTPIELAQLPRINPSRDETLTPSTLRNERSSDTHAGKKREIKEGK